MWPSLWPPFAPGRLAETRAMPLPPGENGGAVRPIIFSVATSLVKLIGDQQNPLPENRKQRRVSITEDELPQEFAVAKEIPSQDKAFAQDGEFPAESGIDVTSIILLSENQKDALFKPQECTEPVPIESIISAAIADEFYGNSKLSAELLGPDRVRPDPDADTGAPLGGDLLREGRKLGWADASGLQSAPGLKQRSGQKRQHAVRQPDGENIRGFQE